MVFKSNIPQPTDKLRTSQSEVLENFSKLDSIFDVNHIKYSDTTGDAGKHTYTTFVNLTDKALASPTTSSEELAVYVKDDAAGAPRLFYREPSDGTEQQLSGSIVGSANGECPLPGGLSLKWGKTTGTGATDTVTYTALGLTAFTTDTYSISLTARTTSNFTGRVADVTASSATGFTFGRAPSASITFYWIAIGK